MQIAGYWLMVTFTCIWGVFHQRSPLGESSTWVITLIGSVAGVLITNLTSNNIIGNIERATVVITLSLCGPLAVIIAFTRLTMWNVGWQLCWEDPVVGQPFPDYCVKEEITNYDGKIS
jgi:hypothetical protein